MTDLLDALGAAKEGSREYPIIFSGPMVRALLDGRKTMTRRLAWRESKGDRAIPFAHQVGTFWQNVRVGDRLWVRESLRRTDRGESYGYRYVADGDLVSMLDENGRDLGQPPPTRASVPSILMPRWMSRITLTVTATKIERLFDLTEADAVREGVYETRAHDNDDRAPTVLFFALWDALHGSGAAKANPEVVALSFTALRARAAHDSTEEVGDGR